MNIQKKILALISVTAILGISSNTIAGESKTDSHTHTHSTLNKGKAIEQYGLPITLMNTIYEGNITAKEMKTLGDIGVGVSNHLNGELTAIDGVVYSIAADGTSTVAPDNLQAPYMSMVKFEPTHSITVKGITSFKALSDVISAEIESVNSFYVFKAKGTFELARLASAHGVEDEDVDFFKYLGGRQMYNLEQTKGTLVGIYTPDYLGTISIPGLHFHFQNGDNTVGGHLEDIRFDEMEFEVQEFDRINLALPNVEEFRTKKMKMIKPPSGSGSGGTKDSK
ncbi:acetolactate decarboxylase [Pseudoalteromonas sp. NZS127_1]|uniref:acetolactate decarboxylase n=1 Tax=Pseudoalteromonas sp. NZS127_1 TaxID=2792074 RepID=UPI0018CCF8ED|nr:acetolactate decarboxylase [Pseudoalteromonas sp. NZS127_1]MBG9996924.1 acetolactate decarboxylase [Pseudoalteromonas sp. NZS127_1]